MLFSCRNSNIRYFTIRFAWLGVTHNVIRMTRKKFMIRKKFMKCQILFMYRYLKEIKVIHHVLLWAKTKVNF